MICDGIVPFAGMKPKGGANHEDVVRVIFFALAIHEILPPPHRSRTPFAAIPYDFAHLICARGEIATAIPGRTYDAKIFRAGTIPNADVRKRKTFARFV
jgi:hypothetical protein